MSDEIRFYNLDRHALQLFRLSIRSCLGTEFPIPGRLDRRRGMTSPDTIDAALDRCQRAKINVVFPTSCPMAGFAIGPPTIFIVRFKTAISTLLPMS